MATASWRTCRGHDGIWPPKCRPNRYIGRRVIAFPIFSSCIGILPFWTTHEVNYAVRLVCETLVSIRSSPLEILRFYDFASLAGVPNYTPFSVVLGGFEPLTIVGRHHNPQKAHPWVRTSRLSHKRLQSVQGCNLGAIAKKSITRTWQDRTGQQKSHKSVICHIFGCKPPVKLSQWNFARW